MPKPVEFWFWMMRDDRGRIRKSPCRFTEQAALKRDPDAARVPGSCEVRNCPDGPDDFKPFSTGDTGWPTPTTGYQKPKA